MGSGRTMRRECPFAQRVWIALLEKGIKFDKQEVDLREDDGGLQSPCPEPSAIGMFTARSTTLACDITDSPVCDTCPEHNASLFYAFCSFHWASSSSQSLAARSEFYQWNHGNLL